LVSIPVQAQTLSSHSCATSDGEEAQPWDCDLLVVGSGAGALSTAVTAAHLGLKV